MARLKELFQDDLVESPEKRDVVLWGRPGFDVGCKAEQGIPRPSYLVNPSGNLQTPTTSVSLSPLKPVSSAPVC